MATRPSPDQLPPSPWRKLFALLLITVACAAIVFTVAFMRRNREQMAELHIPKILNFRVEEVLAIHPTTRPIEVAAGLPALLTCDVTPPPDAAVRTSFRFLLGGVALAEVADCVLEQQLAGRLGEVQELAVEYLLQQPGRTAQVVDRRLASTTLVQAAPFLRIHTFTTPEKTPIATLTVPHRIIPYVDGLFQLEGSGENYLALFFVDPEGAGRPVLQVHVPPERPDTFEVNQAPVRRYRRFGPHWSGYAAWPAAPIQAGNLEDERSLLDVYVGIFRKTDVEQVTSRCLQPAGVSPEGEVQLKVLTPTLDELRALAHRGLFSPPLRVVRALRAPTESKSVWRAQQN